MRIVVIVFLLMILASLGSALLFLLRDKGQGERTVKALAIRVGLSITLFLLLMGGFASGWLNGRL
ncbi:MAG: twin transmembrane helix small protein [Rhodocyclaceae bacterium]|nr:twin transmembrane helix small protein [Rhodocyclaceae bacterium]MCP5231785.1 twin transmembrane helix small protein [Zoogloeaceae bacterium]MCP5241007.1 twin transmembrane helix small protein [Zoogloeaceae bacterium]MCP5255632.1 twin transmembrane helix small protein [Zoogloeaceae bacterium]MCP5294675.1 twin transmembrane helix small protein [Zoogloeaceae bacterium]